MYMLLEEYMTARLGTRKRFCWKEHCWPARNPDGNLNRLKVLDLGHEKLFPRRNCGSP